MKINAQGVRRKSFRLYLSLHFLLVITLLYELLFDMAKFLSELVLSALTIVFAFYGCFHFISEIFVHFLPLGILLTAVLVLATYSLRTPPPAEEAVESIVGKDSLSSELEEGFVVKTIAHRGAGLDAPENTLAAFDLCHTAGCDFIEFDVTLTSDDIPIVFHDATLERMADSNLVIANTTFEVLKSIDLSTKHPLRERFGVTNIPTLYQTVTKLLANGQKMIIDIKDNNRKMVPIILDLYVKFPNLYSNAIVSSFFPNILYLVRRGDPQIVCSMAYRPHIFSNEYFKYPEGKGPERATQFWKKYFFTLCDSLHLWALPRFTYFIVGISIILLHKDYLSAKSVLDWRSKGVRVMAWTVNSPIEKQHTARNLKITYLTDTLTGEASTHNC
ncbi:hypothetical protein HUJ04_011084 [Dendroctonus ponderosae]|uniref:GP-PDE domain-containing protein n=1 Tax=Dendroctonus ponderosae TaxID=77166 RepID=A0AAR5PZP7_DENPD|nr:hypothetical protein HUJ04_011084 [Dendroctonus ponderosae]